MQLRELLHPVRDQGDRETCLSIAASDGHHAARGDAPRLASDFLHFHAAKIHGVGINDGVSAGAVMAALLDQGQPAESDCPYSMVKLAAGWAPSSPSGPLWRRATALETKDAWTTICSHVASGRPVVVIMKIDDAFWAPIAGVIEAPSSMPRASHAVLAIAATASPARVLVRNSWGEEWGDGGYAWLSSAYLAARCTAVMTFGGTPP